MEVKLTGWRDSDQCTWCERAKPCVIADFGDGFIKTAPLCWRCLQKAVRVRIRQDAKKQSHP